MSERESGSDRYRRRTSTLDLQQQQQQQQRHGAERSHRHSRMVRALSRDAGSLKGTLSPGEDNFPTAVPVLLDVVAGPDRLPADEGSQETLRAKLRVLQADGAELDALFAELSAQLLSINSEEKVVFVTFKTFEEIWKFTTYYTLGFLGHCLETLLFEPALWLGSPEGDVSIEVSIEGETLELFYKGLLMQEGSWFASCSASQMFDSSTSGGDLYLEQGDIAQFEPPFLGSGWTVLCLADGARGTAPKPSLEPVVPFHQWFLKSCPESLLVGDGKPARDFPLQFARGACEVAREYDAEGPDELSVAPGERVAIVGLLASGFDWFLGRKDATGEVGLVRTSLVRPSAETHSSVDICLDGEEWMLLERQDEVVIEESAAALKESCPDDSGQKYKLDVIDYKVSGSKSPCSRAGTGQAELKRNIQQILAERVDPPSGLPGTAGDPGLAAKPPPSPPRFAVQPIEEGNGNTELFVPIFSFLEGQHYREELGALYGLSAELLASTVFEGHSDSDELIAFLGAARETARKRRLFWTQTRLCFLLGKLCAARSKFSQARVYLEESLGVPREGFEDLRLLASIFSHLAPVYLLQKNAESFFALTERLAALLLAAPDCLKGLEDDCALRYMLKKAVLSRDIMAEARACHLSARHHWLRGEDVQVVPYLERLLVLGGEAPDAWSLSPSRGHLSLGRLYGRLQLRRLSVAAAKRAALQPAASLAECLSGMLLLLDDTCGAARPEIGQLPQVAPYLRQALALTELEEGCGDRDHRRVLGHRLTVCLCRLLHRHGMAGRAIRRMHALLGSGGAGPSSRLAPVPVAERNGTLLWLAWLHIDNGEPAAALDILDALLASMPEHCTTPQEGVVLNMRGVALRCLGDLRRAAESYEAAADVCQDYEDVANWAVAQANLGLLCAKAGAAAPAQRHLLEAVQLFSELEGRGHEADFIAVLLELGRHYVRQRRPCEGKGCYEWALLLAISANLLDCQLTATGHLCRLYASEGSDRAQSIIYSRHQVELLRRSGDRLQEGDALVAVSKLYLGLATERAYQAALDYTKSSLGIFIDLGRREKEAYGWLQAGQIYHLLGQTELVEIYIQAAQEVALSTGDTGFILRLLEDAGDIFFDSGRDRDKAVTFYRDRALPIAVKSGNARARLRLCNKLTEVMLALGQHGDAVEIAQTALDISVALGERLNERVASHRLAVLFHRLEQYEMAEHYYLKTLSLCPATLQFGEETLYYVRLYRTLGDIMFHHLKDPYDAAGYYHLALAAAMDLGNKRSQLHLCTGLATIYHNFLVDRELSLAFYQRARGLAAELNAKRVNISPEQLADGVPRYKPTG